MGPESTVLIVALIVGLYMAWNIGANDVANAMGTSVGSGALTLKQAVICAAVLEFAGAYFVGASVSETVQKGIVSPEIFADDPMILAYGLLSALLAAGMWLQMASYFGWPVSTTHSIVGALLGFGVVVGGVDAVQWGQVGTIILAWVLSPLLGGVIALTIFLWMRKAVFYSDHPIRAAKKITPYIVFVVMATLTLTLLFKGLKNLSLDLTIPMTLLIAVGIGLVSALIAFFCVRRIKETTRDSDILANPQVEVSLEKTLKHLKRVHASTKGEMQYHVSCIIDDATGLCDAYRSRLSTADRVTESQTVEKIFSYLQILSACFMAFAHGANDVANAIGPLAGVLQIVKTGTISLTSTIPSWVLVLGGVGIVIGLATWGWRVIETVGKKITELTPSRGFAAEFGAAVTIVIASKIGLPISTTHTLIGAVLGVGLARGLGAINLMVIRDIVASWVITLPAGALGAVIFFYIFKAIAL